MIDKIQKLKNKKGFTLVELIVVIAIIAILTAIIVPLVGRYSTQASYTRLYDSASTISNQANTALSDASQGGVIASTYITGSKTSSGLTVNVGSKSCSAAVSGAYSTDPDEKAAQKLYESLVSALPNNCVFYASINKTTVDGVIYAEGSVALTDITPSDSKTIKIYTDTGFDNAYRLDDANGAAVGVSGKYIPTTTTPTT